MPRGLGSGRLCGLYPLLQIKLIDRLYYKI